jgi:hypothetical protein
MRQWRLADGFASAGRCARPLVSDAAGRGERPPETIKRSGFVPEVERDLRVPQTPHIVAI